MSYDIPEHVLQDAANFVARGWMRGVVKAGLLKKYPDLKELSGSQWKSLLNSARAILKEEIAESVGEERERAINFYRALVADELVDDSVRIKARMRLDVLYGLETSSGASAEDQANEVRKYLEALDAKTGERQVG